MNDDLLPLWWRSRFAAINKSLTYRYLKNHVVIYQELKDELLIGYTGPFGGIYSPGNINELTVKRMWQELISQEKVIRIRLAPKERFSEMHHMNLKVLGGLGFNLEYEEINQNLKIGSRSLNRNRLRDYKKAELLGMKFMECSIEAAHKVISINRENKGLKLSLEVDFLLELSKLENNAVSGFSVNHGNSILSSALVIKVTSNYAYVYAWGHNQNIEISGVSLSFLASNLFLELEKRGMENISLGISSIMGKIDPGLFQFKTSLGARDEKILVLKNV